MPKASQSGARSRARELIVQTLYQRQLTDHDLAELKRQFHERPDYERVDQDYYDGVLTAICESTAAIEAGLGRVADRPLAQLDPVERSILMLGYYELESVPDVPYKVVINESVNLARRYGAVDGHKYVNALLDRLVAILRPDA